MDLVRLLVLAWSVGICCASETSRALKFLRDRVKTLSRPVYTYHYTTRAKLGFAPEGSIPSHHAAVRRYVSMRAARYWDLSVPTAPFEIASGLHTAIDPVITRALGGVGETWALLEITLPRGFRFLDVRSASDREPRFPEPIRKQLAAKGCDTDLPNYLMTGAESVPCRQAAIALARELDADGLLYDYPRMAFADCLPRVHGAFLVWRSQAIDPDGVTVLTSASPGDDGAGPSRLRVRHAFLEARRAGSSRTAPWPSLGAALPPKSWMRNSLIGCGGFVEDDPPPPTLLADAPAYWRSRLGAARNVHWVYLHLGDALARRSRSREAAEAYRQALLLEPEFVEAMQALSALYATEKSVLNRAEAVRLATRVIEIVYYRPKQDSIWSKHRKIEASLTLSAADLAAGNLERAASYAVQSLEAASVEHASLPTPLTAGVVARSRRALERCGSAASIRAEAR